ncbi:MAG: 1,4-dihydroxy-2-naphthoate octaprenyltransferase, partial [Acidimicrobiia bacterium]
GPIIIAIGIVSIAAALGYTGGPKPYGYRGLGEIFVFVFFGLVATVGSRFVHDRSAPLDAWLVAIPVGFLVTAILVANNIRDMDTDAAAGKRTLAVLIGRARTRVLFAGLVWGAFAALAVFATADWVPRPAGLGLLAAPLAVPLVRTINTTSSGPPLIRALKGTVLLHALVGALVAAGSALG